MSGAAAAEEQQKPWLQAGVITEHDGSITAVIRHQTKAHQEEDGEEEAEGEDGPRHSCSVRRPLDEVSAQSVRREVNTSAALDDSYRLQAGHGGPLPQKPLMLIPVSLQASGHHLPLWLTLLENCGQTV